MSDTRRCRVRNRRHPNTHRQARGQLEQECVIRWLRSLGKSRDIRLYRISRTWPFSILGGTSRDDATAYDGAGLDVVSKVPAISVPLRIAGAAHAMSIDPFVDSLRDRSPRGVRCGVAKANAARGEAVPPKHARDVLDTAEDVWWAAPTHLAVAEQIRNGDSTAASQKSIGFCEHTADVGHQRDHPRQQYDIGEAVGKRCVICAPLEHVQVREGARGRSACAVHRIDCVDGRVSSPTKPLTDPTCSRTEVHDHVDGRWQRRFERVEHRWEGWARTHDSDHVVGSETERVRTLEPPERWLIEDFRNSSVERHIERNAAPGPSSNSLGNLRVGERHHRP